MPGSPARSALLIVGIIGAAGGVALAGTAKPRATAEATLEAVSAVPAKKRLAAVPLANADDALERADDARAAGDHEHAAMLEGVALEWAETGRDLVRAAETEAEADELAKKAASVEERVARARVLLEQTVARRGRAVERLEELEADRRDDDGEGDETP